MKEPKKEGVVPRGYVRPPEAAAYISTTDRHLRNLMRGGKIPFYKVGRRLTLLKISEIERAIQKYRVSAVGEESSPKSGGAL